MPDILDAKKVRSGTYGYLTIDGKQVADVFGLKAVIKKKTEDVNRCGTYQKGAKLLGTEGTGTVQIYNATNDLMEKELAALNEGRDLKHTIISTLADPDNPVEQRIALYGVTFDELTLADWEAAKLGKISVNCKFERAEWL